jgi:hypothetical protein
MRPINCTLRIAHCKLMGGSIKPHRVARKAMLDSARLFASIYNSQSAIENHRHASAPAIL